MGTNTRPELSEKNKWWIRKHRYYELRHFCLQYPDWQERLKEIDGFSAVSPAGQEHLRGGHVSDPTPTYAEARAWLAKRISLVTDTAFEACDHQFWYTILVEAVTENVSYDVLEARKGIMPVSRDRWYELYRKFFWTLDKMRE